MESQKRDLHESERQALADLLMECRASDVVKVIACVVTDDAAKELLEQAAERLAN